MSEQVRLPWKLVGAWTAIAATVSVSGALEAAQLHDWATFACLAIMFALAAITLVSVLSLLRGLR